MSNFLNITAVQFRGGGTPFSPGGQCPHPVSNGGYPSSLGWVPPSHTIGSWMGVPVSFGLDGGNPLPHLLLDEVHPLAQKGPGTSGTIMGWIWGTPTGKDMGPVELEVLCDGDGGPHLLWLIHIHGDGYRSLSRGRGPVPEMVTVTNWD